ncbi:NAD(P)-dependent oxidoreductase [Streptomyces sp. NBC_01264]|uniref:NAD(P)-dependent oxidoreductase n=1 Tax=Streptomyces sp. NBC_01264 TaxID=2903804 RepID=UPI00224D1811|nr:NAD(P)H-binding protein [Streptomyces sp. NBC_01264]MCX4783812.1 NAD(P)H-binding protein [Streptomyces sp. NBC_01264]
MNILLFGASGHIGSAIAGELLSRGHAVTGVTRTGEIAGNGHEGLKVIAGDATSADTVAELSAGYDAVASAVGPKLGVDDDHKIIVGAANALIEGLTRSGVRRVVVLGGAGSLEVSPGVKVIDNPNFPAMWKQNALAQSEALALYRQAGSLDWTFISPAAQIEPGERTGTYRVGGEQLLVDAEGKSQISIADYAVAFADELERGDAIQARITVAY